MFYVYILRCSDNSFYVGYTTNVETRVRTHNMGIGAAYTFKRLPVKLVYSEAQRTRRTAIRRERQIKGWSREKKEALIKGDLDLLKALAKRKSQPHVFEHYLKSAPATLSRIDTSGTDPP